MARARGSQAQVALAYESTYGTAPGSGFVQVPFTAMDLAAEQPLLDSDILGYGRDPQAPMRDAIDAGGSFSVPVDQVAIGYWLKALLGAPTTVGTVAASGAIVFGTQPVAGSTVTINGTVFTFVASGATGNQSNIGGNLNTTITNLATVLNASVVSGVALATYGVSSGSLTVTYKTFGATGNAFTLACSTSPASNAVVSGATLTGGANSHTFISGSATLPSMALERQNPSVPYYEMFTGIAVDSMKFDIQRKGLVTASGKMIAQGSTNGTASTAGTLTTLSMPRFGTFNAAIKRNGVALGAIVMADLEYSNNMDAVQVIRADGLIDGVDPTVASLKGSMKARFADTTLLTQAINGTDCALDFSWTVSASLSLTLTAHSVYLPRPKISIDGPGGVEIPFDWIAAKATSPARMFTAVLINQQSGY